MQKFLSASNAKGNCRRAYFKEKNKTEEIQIFAGVPYDK